MGKTELNCASCKHWKSNQAELEYSSRAGICTCFKWEFTINNNSDVRILDRDNRSGKFMGVQQLENQSHVIPIGRVSKSRYCLVTAEKFGCIHHLRK